MVPQVLLKIDPQTLLRIGPQVLFKIDSTGVTQNFFHKRYLWLVSQTLHILGSTNLLIYLCVCIHACCVMYLCYVCICIAVQTGSTSVTQNWFHKRYSKLVPQTLLKIGSTSVTKNWFHKCYLKYTNKRYSKLTHKRYSKLIPQVLLKIGFTNFTQN